MESHICQSEAIRGRREIMAREVVIRITTDSPRDPGNSVSPEAGSNTDSRTSVSSERSASSYNKSQIIAQQITQRVVSEAKSVIMYSANRFFDYTEDYKTEQASQNVQAVTNVISSFVGSAMTGAAMGSALGPVGTVVGAVIGGAASVIKTEIGKKKTKYEQDRALREEAYGLYFQTERAGMVNYSRGTDN